ncbi:MAG: polyamine aminopropyltransferase [Deltaproteobacteria bacterium]
MTELWFTEKQTPHLGLSLRVTKTLFTDASPYQTVEVIDTHEFGRVLLLDGVIMTTIRDEFIYHEMIVHPAMNTHPSPRDILVIGGGDGGAVREAVKYPDVRSVELCEIDEMVVETSKRFLPEIACALTGEPRVRVVIQDGIRYVAERKGAYDVLIVDSTDPIGPAVGLFGTDFYCSCHQALRDDGILVAQTESPFLHSDFIAGILKGLRDAGFPIVKFYTGNVPTYPGGVWCWVMASKRHDPLTDHQAGRLEVLGIRTRYYTPDIHRAAFALPRYFSEALGMA